MAVDRDVNILVVDDYPIVIQLIRSLLRQLDFLNVDDAGDARSALQKIKDKKYGLIISDWNMEPMSGLDMLKELRAAGNKVPFIMVTSNNTREHEDEARQAGVSDFISKDVDVAALRVKISIALGE